MNIEEYIQNPLTCDCSHSPFQYHPSGHVITGDLNIIQVKCIETRPPVYLVKDDHGEILEGTFYAGEIQKVIKQEDVYKIQSVPKK
jgi:hypothetical protein